MSHATVVLVYLLKNGNLKPDDFLGDGVGLMFLTGEGARDVRGGVCGMSLGIYEGVSGHVASLALAATVPDGAVEVPFKDNCCIAVVIERLRKGFMLDSTLLLDLDGYIALWSER